MKIMISQPMNGKTNEEIKDNRRRILEKLKEMHIEVIETIFDYDEETKEINNAPVYYLAKSIEKMSDADAILFMNGWETARGCLIEHEIAIKYGIKDLYEDFVQKNENETIKSRFFNHPEGFTLKNRGCL